MEKKIYLFKNSILLCKLCKHLIQIKRIFHKKNNLFVEIMCKCTDNLRISLVEELIRKSACFLENMITRNNFLSFMNNNKWETINLKKSNKYETKLICSCKNNILQYCRECEKFICNSCKSYHNCHQTINYEPYIYINEKKLHKIEKNCYKSFSYLTKCYATSKQIIMKYSNDQIIEIEKYIEDNKKTNDLLFQLFHLLFFTFKNYKCLLTYINLSYFFFFNKPFQIITKNKKEFIKYKINQLFINYCKTNYLIHIQTDGFHFSFLKEIKLYGQKKWKNKKKYALPFYEIIFLSTENNNRLVKGDLLDPSLMDNSFVEPRVWHKFSPMRAYNIFLIDAQTIAIQYLFRKVVGIYHFDIKKNIFSFKSGIESPEFIVQCLLLNKNEIIIIDDHSKLFKVNIKNNKFNLIFSNCQYCIKLNYPRVLFLTSGFIIKNQPLKPEQKYKYILEQYNFFRYGYYMSNGFVLINRKNLTFIVDIDNKKEIQSYDSELFNHAISCCENIQKKILYYQTGSYVIIISTQTFQIHSVYETFHFLFYPLSNSKFDLMNDFFEHINFNAKIVSKFLQKTGYKEIFQISESLFLVSMNYYLYFYSRS